MNLLIMNDEVLVAQAMAKEIPWQEQGIAETYVAVSAAEARTVIREKKVDIALCDIEMPEENGIALIRWIREEGYDIDCIILTCHPDFGYAQEALKLGCQDYLLVPALYEDIAKAVGKAVKRRRKNAEDESLQKYGRQWLDEKTGQAREAQGEKQDPRELADACLNYILQNISDPALSVNDIAANFHLNAIYLNRIIKRVTGSSISQMILGEKMNLAAELLKDGGVSANAVAEKVGYCSYPQFFSAFKKKYGCSPSQYQKENGAE